MSVFVYAGEPHLGQESVELFILGNLLLSKVVGGCSLFKG